MKRLGFAVLTCAVAFGFAACDDDDNPVDPSNQPVVFTAQLSAANEVPPISNAESTARGTAVITFNLTRDAAGAITSGTVTWEVTLNSFPPGARVNVMHIHNGPVGVNAGIFINSGLTAATGIDLTNGTGTINLQNVSNNDTTPAKLQAVINNPAGHYFNAHTTANPGGAVRGQLTRIQ
jgi:CHRD domain